MAPLGTFHRMLWVIGILLALLVLAFLTIVISSTARAFAVQSTLKQLGAAPGSDENGFTNLLILGVGDKHHDGANLTDTMMIASIDPVHTRSVVLLSLPRDLFVDVNMRLTNGRINALYANEKYRLLHVEKLPESEASQQALKTVAEEIGAKLGITIHGVLKADFTAFTTIVDSMDGIDIDVPEAITDYTYPVGEQSTGLFHIDSGPQHLDGETALKYARSRHSTSDFDRSARQQQLLKAIADKVRSMGRLSQIDFFTALYSHLQGHVETTLSTRELLGLTQIAAGLSLDRILPAQINFNAGSDTSLAGKGGFVYPAPPEMFEGASVLVPVTLPGKKNDWSQIQAFAKMLMLKRSLYLSSPDILIENAGSKQIQAHRLHNELLRYGWNVIQSKTVETSHGDVSKNESIVIYNNNNAKDAAEFFGTMLSLGVEKASAPTGSGDIILRLGTGFGYKPFQMLSGALLSVGN